MDVIGMRPEDDLRLYTIGSLYIWGETGVSDRRRAVWGWSTSAAVSCRAAGSGA